MTKPTMSDAEAVLVAAEKAGLEAVAEATATYEAALTAVEASLPETIILDCRSIITQIRNSLNYTRSMIPTAQNKYDPVQAPGISAMGGLMPPAMPAPLYNPNA